MDDLFGLLSQINKRRIADYRMSLAIAQSVNMKNPKDFWAVLDSQDEEEQEKTDTFDAAGFEIFKQALKQNPRFVVK